MSFVIYSPSAKSFLSKNDWVKSSQFAMTFDTFLKANNAIKNNSIKPTLLNIHRDYEIFQCNGSTLSQQSHYHSKSPLAMQLKSEKEAEIKTNKANKVIAKANDDKVKIKVPPQPKDVPQYRKEMLCKFRTMGTYIHNISGNTTTLVKQLSKVDRDISDIQHSIEFYKYNAAEGYNAYRLLREKLLERREIKKQLQIINYMESHGLKEDVLEDLIDYVCNIDDETYHPRNMPELFKEEDILPNSKK